MGYRTLADCIADLERAGQLVRIEEEIDPYLEAAEIQRRVYAAQGPAVFFARVRGTAFPMVCNLFGTLDRLRYMFRDSLAAVARLVELKVDPGRAAPRPWHYLPAARAAWHMRPKRVRYGAVLANETKIDRLPQVTNWPDDGGPFITLPEVYTEDAAAPGWRRSNLGMYRVQLARSIAASECTMQPRFAAVSRCA
jgi:4-hydroxy-3-polyprenylbenzoate decarboxylase